HPGGRPGGAPPWSSHTDLISGLCTVGPAGPRTRILMENEVNFHPAGLRVEAAYGVRAHIQPLLAGGKARKSVAPQRGPLGLGHAGLRYQQLAMQVLVVRVSRQVVGTKPQPTQMWRDVVRGDDRQYSKGGWPFEGRLVAVPLYGIRGTGRELRQVVMCHHPCVEQKFMRRRDDLDA